MGWEGRGGEGRRKEEGGKEKGIWNIIRPPYLRSRPRDCRYTRISLRAAHGHIFLERTSAYRTQTVILRSFFPKEGLGESARSETPTDRKGEGRTPYKQIPLLHHLLHDLQVAFRERPIAQHISLCEIPVPVVVALHKVQVQIPGRLEVALVKLVQQFALRVRHGCEAGA